MNDTTAETDVPVATDNAPDATSTTADAPEAQEDWKAKYEAMRTHARTWEDRAKSNQDAAKRLADLEEQNKSELQRAQETAEKAAQERDAAVRDVMRFRIAAEFELGADDAELFLTGGDEDTMRRQAEALAKRNAPRPPENPIQGAGGNDAGSKSAAQAWAKSLLGK